MPFKTGNWGEQAQARSSRRIEYFRQYQKQRYAQKREEILTRNKQYIVQHPENIEAEWRANYYIEIPEGQLCEECNISSATLRHHPDYSKPLHVQFLCASCHRKITNKAR